MPARGLAAARQQLETQHFYAIIAEFGLATSGGGDLPEGAVSRITVNRYEGNPVSWRGIGGLRAMPPA